MGKGKRRIFLFGTNDLRDLTTCVIWDLCENPNPILIGFYWIGISGATNVCLCYWNSICVEMSLLNFMIEIRDSNNNQIATTNVCSCSSSLSCISNMNCEDLSLYLPFYSRFEDNNTHTARCNPSLLTVANSQNSLMDETFDIFHHLSINEVILNLEEFTVQRGTHVSKTCCSMYDVN